MSESLQDLLSREGVDDADALLSWAHERADALVSELGDDGELGPLLAAGGEAGAAPVPAPPRREPSQAAPLPPIPSKAAKAEPPAESDEPAEADDELDMDDIEELDMEELELLEELDEDDADADEPPAAPPPPEPVEPPSDASSSDAPTADEAAPSDPATDEAADGFGPPDGTEAVPEWKAALMSTQTETDAEAAERVKEASTAEPLPEMPAQEQALSARLEAEEDEISQHSVDLSDLDID